MMSVVEGTMTLVLRTNADPASISASARNEVRKLDADLAVFNVKTMDDLVAGSLAQPRFRTMLLGTFAAVALMLAAIGLYGGIAYSVAQRINAMGVRKALGAQKSAVLQLIVGAGAQRRGIGVWTG